MMNAYSVSMGPKAGKQKLYSAKHLIRLAAPKPDDWFATAPFAVALDDLHQENEEELHSSFDRALNERLGSASWQPDAGSGPLLDTPQVQPVYLPARRTFASDEVELRSAVQQAQPVTDRLSFSVNGLRYACICVCLAVMFALLGFDFMGLLLLHMR